jgi:exosortase/archaeosortase family protein
MTIKGTFTKHRQFFVRLIIFLAVIYAATPITLDIIEHFAGEPLLDFTYFAAFSFMMIALFAAFAKERIFLSKAKPRVAETIIFALLAALFFLIFVKFTLSGRDIPTSNLAPLCFVLYFIAAALAVFGLRFFKAFIKPFGAAFIITYSFFAAIILGTILMREYWGVSITGFTAKLSQLLLGTLGTAIVSISESGSPVLRYGDFSARIDPFCSGIESLVLFTGFAILVAAYDRDIINWKRALPVYLIGLVGIYFVNVLRISVLMLVGTKSPSLAAGLFHNNLGWILFVVYTLAVIALFYPYITKRKSQKKL